MAKWWTLKSRYLAAFLVAIENISTRSWNAYSVIKMMILYFSPGNASLLRYFFAWIQIITAISTEYFNLNCVCVHQRSKPNSTPKNCETKKRAREFYEYSVPKKIKKKLNQNQNQLTKTNFWREKKSVQHTKKVLHKKTKIVSNLNSNDFEKSKKNK